MNQTKRWGLCWTAKVEDPEQGAWVEYADYAALAAENEVLRKKVDWLMKADRLVIWNGTEWQVRHVVEQPIKPRE